MNKCYGISQFVGYLARPINKMYKQELERIREKSGLVSFFFKGEVYAIGNEMAKPLPKELKQEMKECQKLNDAYYDYRKRLYIWYEDGYHDKNLIQHFYDKSPSYIHPIIKEVFTGFTPEPPEIIEIPDDIKEIFQQIYVIGRL